MTGNAEKKQNSFIYILLGAVFLTVLLCAQRLMYVIHDDVYIRDIAAGAISGQPDYHLVYMHSVLGVLLAGLYGVLPGVDWYGVGLTLLGAVCFLLVLRRLLSMGHRRLWILAAWMIGVVCVGLYYLVLFQYTVTAGIAGATAIFLFCTRKEEGNKVGIGFLLVLTFLIRQETFLMVFPVFVCMAAYEWLKDRKKSHVILVGSVVLLAGIFLLAEKAAYSDDEWQEYMRYNEARSQVFDYYGVPPYAGNEAFYDSLGMEEYQVINLERYNVYLLEDLSAERMEAIAAYAKEQYLTQHSLTDRARTCLKTVFWGLLEVENRPVNWITALTAIGACLVCIRNRSRRLWLCGAVLALEAAFWLYLGWKGRFFWRVGACLFLVCLAAMGAVLLLELREKPLKVKHNVWIVCILIGGVILSGVQYRKVSLQAEKQNQLDSQMEELKEYCEAHPENLYFSIVGVLHPYSEPLEPGWTPQVSNLMSLGDWTAFAPVTEQKMARFGLDRVPEDLVKQDHVYLLLTGESSAIEKSCLEFADALSWEQVDTVKLTDLELQVYKLEAIN